MVWNDAGRWTPEVSVIIPTFNVRPYIGECLRSVWGQDDVSLEIVLIDDASTDGTREEIEEFRKQIAGRKRRPESLHFIPLEANSGQASARNRGIDVARGRYIAFLDSDDRLNNPKALAQWIRVARQTDAQLTRASYSRISEDGEFISHPPLLGCETLGTATPATMPELVNISACWQILYQRKFLRESRLRFSEELRQREDRLFFLQCLLRAERVTAANITTVDYRSRANSTMKTINWEQLSQFVTHIKILNSFIQKNVPEYDSQHGPFAAFLTANALNYMRSIAHYWKRLLCEDGAYRREEMQALCSAAGALGPRGSAFHGEKYLQLSPEHVDKNAGMYYDLLHYLCQRRQTKAIWNMLRSDCIPINIALDLIRASEIPTVLTKIINRYYSFSRGTQEMFQVHQKSARNIIRTSTAAGTRPEITFHFGFPKTGSSAIQQALEDNRIQMYTKGIWYPVLGIERGRGFRSDRIAGHAKLFDNILNGDGMLFLRWLKELESLPVKPQRIILSAENTLSARFWSEEVALRTIFSAFSDFPKRVVVFARRQHEWLESMYNEMANNPNNIDFVETPSEFGLDQIRSGYLFYDELAEAVNSYVGHEQCRFVSYDECVLNGGSVNGFANAAGIDLTDIERHANTNASNSVRMARFMVKCNRNGVDADTKAAFYIRMRDDSRLVGEGFQHYSLEESEEIFAGFRNSNVRFMGRHDGFEQLLQFRQSSKKVVTDEDLDFLEDAFVSMSESEDSDIAVDEEEAA